MEYKLLTPGPLTTTMSVKKEMLVDHCTWDDDYKKITQEIRSELLRISDLDKEEYTAILMQGSGTFGVESVISSIIPKDGKLLVLANGAYGKRIATIAKLEGIDYIVLEIENNQLFNTDDIKNKLEEDKKITHIAMVHSETTTGILNNIEEVAKTVKEFEKDFIVDAMSSFAGVNIDIKNIGVDYLISSANKCIQGVPGFSFIICKKDKLTKTKGFARTLSLNLYDQYETMDKDGKWRFTSPTHTVLAFRQALRELDEEGGIKARAQRYRENNNILNKEMEKLGFKLYIDKEFQGPIISTFLYPKGLNIDFKELYEYIKNRGFIIYPGKTTDIESFRIGNIGEIYKKDIYGLIEIFKEFLAEKKFNKNTNLENLEAVILDWAGTAVDFGCMAPLAAFKEAFINFGIEVTEEEIRKPMGMLKIDHIRTMLNMDRISREWNEKYGRTWNEEDVSNIYKLSEKKILDTVIKHADIKPYTKEFVAALRKNNVKIGSTTGYTDEMMQILTKEAEKNGYAPDTWVTPNSVNNYGRPYPFMIFENMKRLGVKSIDNIIKIGDTLADIKEGRCAGLTTIGIIDGSSLMGLSKTEYDSKSEEELNVIRRETREKYINAGADFVVQDLKELISLLGLN